MKRIGFNVTAKNSLSLSDIECIMEYKELSVKYPKDKLFYSKKVLGILTDIVNPRFYHVFLYLEKAINSVGCGDPSNAVADPKKMLNDLVHFLSSNLKQPPEIIRVNVQQRDVKGLTTQIRIDKAKDYLNMIMIQHDPSNFSKELVKELKILQSTIRETLQIKENTTKVSEITESFVTTEPACLVEPKGLLDGR